MYSFCGYSFEMRNMDSNPSLVADTRCEGPLKDGTLEDQFQGPYMGWEGGRNGMVERK